MEDSRLLTLEEAAAHLGINVRRLCGLISVGEIPVVEFSPRVRRVPQLALHEWTQSRIEGVVRDSEGARAETRKRMAHRTEE